MQEEQWMLAVITLGPAVIALLAVIGGVALLVTGRKEEERGSSTLRTVLAVGMLVIALGIGACYGVVFLSM